tara:strand:- start:372 stop:512 length:141 start_codon:yes stop_codon:yes gene_type:complete
MRNLDKDTKYLDNIKIAYDKAKDPAVKVMWLKKWYAMVEKIAQKLN